MAASGNNGGKNQNKSKIAAAKAINKMGIKQQTAATVNEDYASSQIVPTTSQLSKKGNKPSNIKTVGASQ